MLKQVDAGDLRVAYQDSGSPDGVPALTVEQAANLKPAAMNAILGTLLEVNDIAAGN